MSSIGMTAPLTDRGVIDVHPGIGPDNAAKPSSDHDWSYLRANLDHPKRYRSRWPGIGLIASILTHSLKRNDQPKSLVLKAQISLGPRQTVALLEADGIHLLVATSENGAPSFFPLNAPHSLGVTKASFDAADTESRVEPAISRPEDRSLNSRLKQENANRRRLRISGRVSW